MERIVLGNQVFEGRNNAYLFTDGPVTLVDTGIDAAAVREDLASALAAEGLEFADVERLFVTHYHPDHAGLAGYVQQASDATVYVHEADAPLVAGDDAEWDAIERRRRELYDEWGMPADKQRELMTFFEDGPELFGDPADVEPIADGDEFTVDGERMRVIHAPGHAAGLVCFAFEERGEILTGDALLPVYTPNVGGADVRVDRPLERYLDTLERLAQRDDALAFPGHRDPIEDPAGRAREILDHHEERAFRVLSILREHGPADAWTVSDHLFGDLSEVHILHGPGEATAHLDHLARAGALDRTDEGFALASGVADALDARSDERWRLT
ncbi:MBL fold metallo-hydrolase [Halorarius halobius]|uniref:MBL fold metallo-hydrolase n=1 Tax=Halorarius halobius TaxID=2962671 RepID=UPI0020CCC09B|nr:MBL fold metallo-hydrolase [Halorarius halobius]